MSTALLVKPLSDLLGRSVRFIEDCQGPDAERAVSTMTAGSIGILENTRFHAGEEKNDPELAKAMAALGDFYVDDAFSTAHRAHASTEGHHAFPPELRRPRDGSGAESAGARARQSRAAGRGGRRRCESLDQARRARAPRRQGRPSDHRRRNGEHLPRRARRERRQVALRARADRRGERDLRARGRGRLHHPPAVRRGGREGIRAQSAGRAHRQRA